MNLNYPETNFGDNFSRRWPVGGGVCDFIKKSPISNYYSRSAGLRNIISIYTSMPKYAYTNISNYSFSVGPGR